MQSLEFETRSRAVMREVLSRKDEIGARLLRQVNAYLKECFKGQSAPHVSELAITLGCSVSTLSRRFRSRVGVNLSDYFKDQQVACAQRLLRYKRFNVDRIVKQAGFGTRRTFYRAFKRRTGITPSEYRRRVLPPSAT